MCLYTDLLETVTQLLPSYQPKKQQRNELFRSVKIFDVGLYKTSSSIGANRALKNLICYVEGIMISICRHVKWQVMSIKYSS